MKSIKSIGIGLILIACSIAAIFVERQIALNEGVYSPKFVVFSTIFATIGLFVVIGTLISPNTFNGPTNNSPKELKKIYLTFGLTASVGLILGLIVLHQFEISLLQTQSTDAPVITNTPSNTFLDTPVPSPDIPVVPTP